MTHPLGELPIRGVIWYQGEADAMQPEAYVTMFGDLVDAWRKQFNDEDLPVYFAQLTAFAKPPEDLWRRFREHQRAIAAPEGDHVEMVVTIDVGDSDDIHPRRKPPVGERMARYALRDIYGMEMLADAPHRQASSGRMTALSASRTTTSATACDSPPATRCSASCCPTARPTLPRQRRWRATR